MWFTAQPQNYITNYIFKRFLSVLLCPCLKCVLHLTNGDSDSEITLISVCPQSVLLKCSKAALNVQGAPTLPFLLYIWTLSSKRNNVKHLSKTSICHLLNPSP